MFFKHAQIAPARITCLLKAAEAAARAIPPAFPLEATVAVNPFLGQTVENLAMASARLGRVAGVRLTLPRAEYAAKVASGMITDEHLADALIACASPLKPVDLSALKGRLHAPSPDVQALPTLADLAAEATGRDWPAVIQRTLGLWAAGHFDRGQALWTPAPGQGAFAAWRAWASHDLTPEVAGLSGFCAHVATAPDTAERALLRACETLGITEAAAETVFHRLLVDLAGWAQHARWLLWQAELAGTSDPTLTDLLAIRLIWEEAIFVHAPQVESAWDHTLAAHAQTVVPSPDQVIDVILQDAAERAHQWRLEAMLPGATEDDPLVRPALQAAFCIDVRSEVFRRVLESVEGGIATIGFAGFFGLRLAHRSFGSDVVEAHLPVLLNPGLSSHGSGMPEVEQAARITARTTRAWGRFRQAAVSSFAFVEAAGPAYGWKLAKDALGLGAKGVVPQPTPQLDVALTPDEKAATGAAVLKAMSLTTGHARLVLLLGHGAQVANNPHESAYHCGACGGYTGEVSSRLLAALLNDAETRAGLPGHGIDMAPDTLFVAGLHNTTTD
ncbi:MAG: putative inorganic carbon transporter subunit DabA, partial [Cypionkella sp.]